MTKILILNVGWSNKGNVALVKSTMNSVNKFIHDAEFILMGSESIDFNNYKVKEKLGKGISRKNTKSSLNTIFYLVLCFFIYLLNKINIRYPISKKSKLFDYYNCDIVINSGGDHLSGEYGLATLDSFINILYCIFLGKPVVLYGESLGYFRNTFLKYFANFVFNKTKLIIVRDEISEKYLRDNNITNPDIYITGDPAFLLDPVPLSDVYNILSMEGINEIHRPLIGINASGLISNFMEGNSEKAETYTISMMSKVIDNLVETLDANIILVPHVYAKTNDDRSIIRKIYRDAKNKHKVAVIENEYSPEELKGIIGQCDLFIGARMHSTIASTSMFVPTVGIAYSHKMYGIIGKMLGQDKYIIDIKQLNYEILILTIKDAWDNREIIENELKMNIPNIKEKALLNGKLVKEMFDKI
jgi:polysaccharide pyruvyl transferase WcaK-like protein